MNIRTTFYFDTGREQSSHDCGSLQEAYGRCVCMNMTAHAVNLRTDRLYIWRPAATNTFEAFSARLNDIVLGEVL